ncbi:MAG: DUF805 domain-containing protein [Asticcacaulis sp.]|nr:DUF805 domain-containing protein [Asticcacaulis sp.]
MAAKAPFNFGWFFFSMRGRISRLAFFSFVGLTWVLQAGSDQAITWLLRTTNDLPSAVRTYDFGLLPMIGLVLLWPQVCATVKRLHDLGWPAILVMPAFGPLLMALVLIAFPLSAAFQHLPKEEIGHRVVSSTSGSIMVEHACLIYLSLLYLALSLIPGQRAPNRHGPSPLAPYAA